MKIAAFIIAGMGLALVPPLRGDSSVVLGEGPPQKSAYLLKHEKNLERMKGEQRLDNENTRRAQKEFNKSSAEVSDQIEQQARDVLALKSVEIQVQEGQKQKALARQSYKEAVQKYGSEDPRSGAAQQNWKVSQQAMGPLQLSRSELKGDIHRGRRSVHNDKTLLSIQQRTMGSNARYRAIDDRKILKEEKLIAGEKNAMTQNVRTSESSSSK